MRWLLSGFGGCSPGVCALQMAGRPDTRGDETASRSKQGQDALFPSTLSLSLSVPVKKARLRSDPWPGSFCIRPCPDPWGSLEGEGSAAPVDSTRRKTGLCHMDSPASPVVEQKGVPAQMSDDGGNQRARHALEKGMLQRPWRFDRALWRLEFDAADLGRLWQWRAIVAAICDLSLIQRT